MKIIEKRTTAFSLKRPVVGCGIQGDDCLAMLVSQVGETWSVKWALSGALGEPIFADQLSSATGKTPLWTPPTEEGLAPSAVTIGVELSGGEVEGKDRVAALKTQTSGRFANPVEVVTRGLEISNGDEEESLLVGSVAIEKRVAGDFSNWRKIMKIRSPHIASTSLAIANAYLTLYRGGNPASKCRILFVEGRTRTRAIVMDGWKFIDSLEFRMMENQCLTDQMILRWIQEVGTRNVLPRPPVPLVISRSSFQTGVTYEKWEPFPNPVVAADETVSKLLRENLDLATEAFGMALQGGV